MHIHTELHGIPNNLQFLVNEVVPKIHDDYGVKPTFFIQVEPPQCNKENLFRQFPDIINTLAKYGEIGLHSHWFHNKAPLHQAMHIKNATLEGQKFHPISWCSGDWLFDKHTLETLEIFGLKIDSSITPPRHTYLNPQLPYNPSKSNIYQIANPHFKVLEVPNTPKLRLTPEPGAMANRRWTTGWLAHLNQQVDDVPLILPCHSYDFVVQERYWHLLGYLRWLTEIHDVEMVTVRNFLNYKSNVAIKHPHRFYLDELNRIRRSIWKRSKK